MNLSPLLDSAAPIPLHASAAMAGFVLGIVQLIAPKGTLSHRVIGWAWVLLLAVTAISSFWIHSHGFRLWRDFGPIHLLSIFAPVMLVIGVLRARRHRVRAHAITMVSIFVGALVVAGVFTLVPGRVMHMVVFGR
ncbi:DUF2306 domain-containing protein [Tardiphaga alba]|uniref:DUF2306 domain-containing protein n=1 Tax=Tardiphaga alba TaxID=340268 RepID=A0ABX8ABS5_9BRAD|nr:DUF2306 domain-containing protein [Tardiphaga alba]QUS40099.1 DUF2306 domain-containing protein [Tardiphaga alba]